MEEPVATTDTTCEPHTPPPHRHLSKLHLHQQHHFHFPPVTFHNLAQKMKTKAPWHKKQQNAELVPFCPETDIRETNLAYHIEIAMPGIKDKESLVIQWMSPRTLIVQGNLTRPDVGFGKPAEGERQWEGENDGWATEARNPPMVSLGVQRKSKTVHTDTRDRMRLKKNKTAANYSEYRQLTKKPKNTTCQSSSSTNARSVSSNVPSPYQSTST